MKKNGLEHLHYMKIKLQFKASTDAIILHQQKSMFMLVECLISFLSIMIFNRNFGNPKLKNLVVNL